MSYGMVYSPRQLFPAIRSQAKTNFPITDYLSTCLFHPYNKSSSELSETQRMRLPKLRSLTRLALHAIKGMACIISHIPNDYFTLFTLSFPVSGSVHKQLPVCLGAQ